MFWLVILLLCALAGATHAGVGDLGHKAEMSSRYHEAPSDQSSDTPPLPSTVGSDVTHDEVATDYLRTITDQRTQVAGASETLREFLLDPGSLDQRKRTLVLKAIATLQANAAAAAALEPPPELASLHAQHLESLQTLATAGALYTTGMDTHDPSQWDRARRVLADGTALFEAVGSELEQIALPE